jgi:hypothetical protein
LQFVHVNRRRAEIDRSSDRELQLGVRFLSPKSKHGPSGAEAICDLATRLDRRTKFADYLAPDDVSPVTSPTSIVAVAQKNGFSHLQVYKACLQDLHNRLENFA